jgi:hypothetical protein
LLSLHGEIRPDARHTTHNDATPNAANATTTDLKAGARTIHLRSKTVMHLTIITMNGATEPRALFPAVAASSPKKKLTAGNVRRRPGVLVGIGR